MKVSILALTLNRYDVTLKALVPSLSTAGYEFELLVCDNGSADSRVIELVKNLNPAYFRENKANEGTPNSLNQLFLRSTGDLIVTLANDIIMPENWLAKMVSYALAVPYCGLIGIHCVASLPPLSTYEGVEAHYITPKYNRVFSNIAIKREVINKIGFYSSDYAFYGMADSDLCERVTMAGYKSFYIPNLTSNHIGVGVNDSGEYRKTKDEYLKQSQAIFNQKAKTRLEALKEKLPELKNPLTL